MTPSIKEGSDLRYDLIDLEPELAPLKAERSSGKSVPVEGKKALVYGDGEATVVGRLYSMVSHTALFSRTHEIITENFPVAFWKVETAVGMKGAIARATWFLWTDEFTYTFGDTEYILLVRALNSYDGHFPLCVELGLMNTDNKGRIPLQYTRQKRRHRGSDLVDKVVSKLHDLITNRNEWIEQRIPRLERAKIKKPVDTLELLSLCEDQWIPKKAQQEIRYKFEADGCESVLDLISLLGWYGNRLSNISRQVLYRQEFVYKEMSNVADLK